jgi:hypothetical protein
VAGEGGLSCDDGCFLISDLANQDDVWVQAQDAPELGGKGDSRFGMHLHLADVTHVVFHWVLNGDDLFSARSIWRMEAYNVVLLPDPVGPQMTIMP